MASTFWHRLACTEPPSGLLAKLQALIVDFFWTKFHWVPQSVLYLPKEEGGQGLVHLASRGATFRLQFIQRFLTGPEDLVWRNVSNFILSQVGGLGLDSALFLMDSSKIQLNGLTPFYKGVFTFTLYMYAFSRCFYPKQLTIAFRLYIFISTCVPWESNPQPFVQLTQCCTTEPQEHSLEYGAYSRKEEGVLVCLYIGY